MRKILLVFAMAALVALLVLGARSFRNNSYQVDPPKMDSKHSRSRLSREVNAATITEEREAEYAELHHPGIRRREPTGEKGGGKRKGPAHRAARSLVGRPQPDWFRSFPRPATPDSVTPSTSPAAARLLWS